MERNMFMTWEMEMVEAYEQVANAQFPFHFLLFFLRTKAALRVPTLCY